MNGNKTALVFKLAAQAVFLVLAIVFAVMLATNGIDGLRFSFGNAETGELVMSKSFDGVEKLDISTLSYSVEVERSEQSNTTLEFYSGIFKSAETPEISCEAQTLFAEQKNASGLADGKIVIKVPKNAVIDYNIDSESGSIKTDLDTNTASVSSVSGSVRIAGSGKTLRVSTVSGSIRVYEPFESVKASSVSGSLRLAADRSSKTVDAGSTSGSIRIALADKGLSYSLSYSTVSGSVKDEYADIKYGGGSGRQGDGALKISANTVSGSIKLSDWDD